MLPIYQIFEKSFRLLKKVIFSSDFNTIKVTNMSKMFLYCSSLEEINLSSFNTTINVKYIDLMCWACFKLQKINLSSFNLINAKSMKDVFFHVRI